MADTIVITTNTPTVLEVSGKQGPQGPVGAPGATGATGPQGPAGTGIETLTTAGDLLYRDNSAAARLPIGSSSQILKVVNGLPAWANESGAVSSVAGRTGAVTLASVDISSEQVLEVSEAGDANCNGVFVYGGDYNGRPTYYKDKNTFVYWDTLWNISHNADDKYVGTNTSRPWQAVWSLGSATGSLPVVEQLNGQEYEKAVGQRTNPTAFGTASGKNVGTGANDVAAGNHTHSSATTTVAGFLSASDKTKLDGIATGAEVNVNADWNASSGDAQILNKPTIPSASSATPSALGVAAAGSSANFARADHVHAMPSASDVGAPPTSRTISAGTGLTGGGDLSANRTLSVSFGSSAGSVCEGNDARLSDSRTPTAHAASHAAGTKASYNDQVGGMTEDAFIRANTAGTAGNSIALAFDGVDDINTVIAAWNSANPSNQATLVSGDGSQVPDNGEEITLSGGVASGSDPLNTIKTNALTVQGTAVAGQTPDTVLRGGAWFGAGDGSSGVAIYKDGSTSVLKFEGVNEAVAAYVPLQFSSNGAAQIYLGTNGNVGIGTNSPSQELDVFGNVALRDLQNDVSATFEAQDNLTANRTYDLPDASGTLALTSDIPANTIASTLVDAKGDLIVGTAADTVARLPVGATNGHVLTVDSAEASGMKWAAASGGVSAIGASAADILSVSGSDLVADDPNADRLVFWDDSAGALKYLTAGSGLTITDMTITASGGVGGGSGSVDNAIIRADGTGGSTVQSSDINILDATTSTQNNVAITNEHSGQTNSGLVLTPKGTGAFVLGPRPDGTTTGGNARGARAVDLQWETRFAATMVASGQASAILNGLNNTASATYAVAWGQSCTASGNRSTAGGFSSTASGAYSGFAIGWHVTASGSYGATAIGAGSTSDRQGMLAFASGRPWSSNAGVAQNIVHVLHGKTTTNAAVELLAGDWNEGTVRLTVPSGRVMTGLLTIVGTKSDGATVASYMRQVTIKNVGGTTSLVGTVNMVGVDEAGGTSISITANDTNDALKVEATGVASQIFRWVCTASMTEMTYGT